MPSFKPHASNFKEWLTTVPPLMVLTGDHYKLGVLEQVELCLRGGVKIIQYRSKFDIHNPTVYEQVLLLCKQIAEACLNNGALFLINDFIPLCHDSSAQGLHLGLDDSPVYEARKVLDSKVIIGGTVHNVQDALRRSHEGVQYIGIGPYRFTQTKDNLAPLLGLSGIKEICQSTPNIPAFAIGGIRPFDVGQILSAGAEGIAVSSAIFNSPYPHKSLDAFISALGAAPLQTTQIPSNETQHSTDQ